MNGGLAGWRPPPFPERRVLEGHWCRLEPLNVARHGADLWRCMAGHDDVWTWLFDAPPVEEAAYRELLARMTARTDIVPLALVDKTDGVAKGHFWIMEIRPAHGVFEVGSITWSPALQRTPAATEAIRMVGDEGFALGYRRYEWKCNDRNKPSKRAALRFGFTAEGLFRQHMVIKGESRDTAWFSILDHEWPARRTRMDAWLDPSNFDGEGRQRRALSAIPL
ncbi:MAG: GNAT family N-acetyltransferase [Beijerinckiaceae bacterium]